IALRSMAGRDPGRLGNAEPGFSPSGLYPCADGTWVALIVKDDAQWRRLVETVAPALDGWASFGAAARVAARDALDDALAGWSRGARRTPSGRRPASGHGDRSARRGAARAMAPDSTHASISAGVKPSAAMISSVCSPSAGETSVSRRSVRLNRA